ncbi:tRNA (adenosine(37)-N6)-threonylcarbamoyltransferase complex dimerization subunit type 1 TsaB [Clostridium sp. SYSU_GA19001]|uniref:tRNA (adenosine(37)-N6)-threonylcarbamoyltransferase complex dimerization subunit type 1 TsaB n=1 Tax=Clostridium caldaquaticum TaxID=2940653 RepID=UPI0020778AB8|nr:tRNA (adenosine(37)-N6)-threonylcarbamoyltransferase complex dimerization subunit type 1 TsaB [Clostridium caldaquaticum]MCM8709760.1 tRNA (adenosine(37)-N6)-threonylcarbamoyltransferase complex dimerization subunit type 1 TsaB [Clostridium caldaquaticum]
MIVLSIDSATESASCAVLSDEKLLGEINLNDKKQHSVVLMPMVDNLLKSLKLTIKDIDGFVVSKGPGSFTGLRIGMSMVKGLSQGTNKPFVSVSSLDALAFNMAYSHGLICPIIDALRDNVYTALYCFEDGKINRLTDYMALHIDELINIVKEHNKTSIFVGDAVGKFKEKLNESLNKVYFAPSHLNIVKASSLGELGINLLSSGNYDDLYTSAPIYLRKPQAEREYEKKMGIKNE